MTTGTQRVTTLVLTMASAFCLAGANQKPIAGKPAIVTKTTADHVDRLERWCEYGWQRDASYGYRHQCCVVASSDAIPFEDAVLTCEGKPTGTNRLIMSCPEYCRNSPQKTQAWWVDVPQEGVQRYVVLCECTRFWITGHGASDNDPEAVRRNTPPAP